MKLGDVPYRSNGQVDRTALAEEFGWTIRELYLAKDAWRKLYCRQPQSTLTFRAYLEMIRDAGLRPGMIGVKSGQHQLARYKDQGVYSPENCRFITREKNLEEMMDGFQHSEATRRKLSAIALQRKRQDCAHCGISASAGMMARWHGERCRAKRGAA